MLEWEGRQTELWERKRPRTIPFPEKTKERKDKKLTEGNP